MLSLPAVLVIVLLPIVASLAGVSWSISKRAQPTSHLALAAVTMLHAVYGCAATIVAQRIVMLVTSDARSGSTIMISGVHQHRLGAWWLPLGVSALVTLATTCALWVTQRSNAANPDP